MFVIGGVTHYEVSSVQNLEHSQGMQNIVLGSNEIMNSRDFIMNLTTKD